MSEVVDAIRRVTDIVAEISAASVEQRSGVEQIGQAVTKMDEATQQNAALVEQSAAAAESLRQQAQRLVNAVAVFKLGSQADGPRATEAPTKQSAPHKPAPLPSARPAVPAVVTAAASLPAEPFERRSPNRARNVVRPEFGAAAAAGAIATQPAAVSDEWESF
jgi:methyl-accepting chemotaxis protein